MKSHNPDLFSDEQQTDAFVMIRRDAIQAVLCGLSDPARRVLLALATFADSSTGKCFPSREAIAKRAGLFPAHKVSYATAELAEAGYLIITQTGKRKCNAYELKKVMYLQKVHHLISDVPVEGTTPRGDVPRRGTGDVPSRGTSLSNENHITRKKGTAAADAAPRIVKSRSSGEPRMRELMERFKDLHLQHRGVAYVPHYAADGQALKTALAEGLSGEEVTARMVSYFIRRDKWNEQHGYTIRNFVSCINGLNGRSSGGKKDAADIVPQPTPAMEWAHRRRNA